MLRTPDSCSAKGSGFARRRWRTALLAAGSVVVAAACGGPRTRPPPPYRAPAPTARDQQCAQRFEAEGGASAPRVERDYPLVLNPRDPRGRLIFPQHHYPSGVHPQRQCYVETDEPMPPDMPRKQQPVPCPPPMQHPSWWECLEGRIVTNAQRCPCVCYAQHGMSPPLIKPVACPP